MKETKSLNWDETKENPTLPPGESHVRRIRSKNHRSHSTFTRVQLRDQLLTVWANASSLTWSQTYLWALQVINSHEYWSWVGSLSLSQEDQPICPLRDITGWSSCLPRNLLFPFNYPPTVIPESPTLTYLSQLVTDWNDLFLCLSLTLG